MKEPFYTSQAKATACTEVALARHQGEIRNHIELLIEQNMLFTRSLDKTIQH